MRKMYGFFSHKEIKHIGVIVTLEYSFSLEYSLKLHSCGIVKPGKHGGPITLKLWFESRFRYQYRAMVYDAHCGVMTTEDRLNSYKPCQFN